MQSGVEYYYWNISACHCHRLFQCLCHTQSYAIYTVNAPDDIPVHSESAASFYC